MTFEDELRVALLTRTREDLGAMRAAAARSDYPELRRLGHRLHGAAGAMELDTLAGCGHEIDKRATARDPAGIADALHLLQKALDDAAARAAT
jgi:HPt (histidine-containing phosphotransfer) domain-containing protein